MATTKTKEKVFGPTFKDANFPNEMRRQLWPLCCGASILSGFKTVNQLDPDELVTMIEETIKSVPDFQVFSHEKMKPALTFLTLNSEQMKSNKIMTALQKCGFIQIGVGSPRGHPQGFFLKDTSNTWKNVA